MARSASNPELNAFVAEALHRKSKGVAAKYEELKSLLRECRKRVEQEPEDAAAVLQLCTLLGSVTANVSAVQERKHEAVVAEILGIRLWGMPQAVQTSVLDFTSNLIVANSAFTHTCLQLLVYSFTPPLAAPNPADPSQDPHGPWRPAEPALALHASLLSCLSKVLGLVPTAPTNMLPLIMAQMPHKLRDRNTQCLYLSALFRLAEDRAGAPIREALLTAVVEHLLSMDVEIKWEDIVDVPTGEEEEEGGDEADVFELEDMLATELDINATPEEIERRHCMLALRQGDGRGGWEGAAAGHPGAMALPPAASARPPVDEMANKLDSMMELAFEHVGKRIAAGQLKAVWNTLLAAFERTVLNTHRSKFTQFLLFYACLSDPAHCPPGLVRALLGRLRDARQPPITRAACAAYLASFLARAAYLSEALVVKTMQELAAFCVDYCNNHAGGFGSPAGANGSPVSPAGGAKGGGPAPPSRASSSRLPDAAAPFAGLSGESDAQCDTQRHQVLYAAVQALLYVLCYHMQPIVGSAPGASGQGASGQGAQGGAQASERQQHSAAVVALVREPLWQVLHHRLQPLAVCLPSVAAEFVHQAAALGVVDCRELLAKVQPASRVNRPLEMFFPFDPYLLRRSSRYLQLKTSYVRWRHGHPQATAGAGAGAVGAGGADSDEEDEDEGSEEDEDEEAGVGPHGESDEELSSSTSSDAEEDEGAGSDGDDVALEMMVGGASLPSDGVLHDPKHRLHAGARRRHAAGHHHDRHGPHAMHGVHGRGRGGVGGGSGGRHNGSAAMLGTSYMSYTSVDGTASLGDGNGSPYGMSPYEGGGMLVGNPLGASPGAVPMSLGTPEVRGTFIAQVPMRIGRR